MSTCTPYSPGAAMALDFDRRADEVRRCKLDPNLKAPTSFKGSTLLMKRNLASNFETTWGVSESLRHYDAQVCARVAAGVSSTHLGAAGKAATK